MQPSADGNRDPVLLLMGAGAVCLGHAGLVLSAMVLGMAFDSDLATGILLIGVVQVVHVLPLLIWSRRTRRMPFFWGVLGAAALTALLNGGCWGVVLHSMSGI